MAMKSFAGKFAVISGGANGMGRSLVLQLAKAGCASAFSDLNKDNIAETIRLAAKEAPGIKITGHVADVSKEEDWTRFRGEALDQHSRKSVVSLSSLRSKTHF
jgi:NAD(P)-dependent dehydrogenase (short-subunit alcohol dehydrogenase family)